MGSADRKIETMPSPPNEIGRTACTACEASISALTVAWKVNLKCGSRARRQRSSKTGGTMGLRVNSPVFSNGSEIPRKYTCDGQNATPPLEWSGVPEQEK